MGLQSPWGALRTGCAPRWCVGCCTDLRDTPGRDFCQGNWSMVMYGSKSRGCITLVCSQSSVCRTKIKPRSFLSSHCFQTLFQSAGHEVKWLKQKVVQWETILMMLGVPHTFPLLMYVLWCLVKFELTSQPFSPRGKGGKCSNKVFPPYLYIYFHTP